MPNYRPTNPFGDAPDPPPRKYRPTNPFAAEEDVPTMHASPGLLGGLPRMAAQGASLGWSDEAIGALAGLGALVPGGRSPGEAYGETVDSEREKMFRYRQAHPVAALGAELAGGVGTGIAANLLTGGAALPAVTASLGRTVATGAALGGIAGAGAGRGNPLQRLPSTIMGTAAGAATAPLAPVAGWVGSKVGGLASRLGTAIAGDAAERAQGAVLPKLGGALQRIGAERLGGRVAGATPFSTADERANSAILSRLEMDRPQNTSLTEYADQLAGRARESTVPTSLLMEGGENMRGLGSAVANQPGPARQQLRQPLEQRVRDQTKYLSRDAQAAFGLRRENVYNTADELVEAQRTKAAPLYKAAFERGDVVDPALEEVFDTPSMHEAYKRAMRIAREEHEPIRPLFNSKGERDPSVVPDVRTLHYLKLGLDDQIETATGKAGESGLGGNALRAVMQTKEKLIKALDRIDEYKVARETFAGDWESRRALEAGQKFLQRTDPRLLRREFEALGTDEQELFKRGAMDAFIERMRDTKLSRDVSSLFDDEKLMERIQIVFGDDALGMMQRAMTREGNAPLARNALYRGSPTAARLADQGQTDAETLGTIARALAGDPAGALRQAGGRAVGRLSGLTPRTSEALGQKLSAGLDDPQDLAELLYQLEARAARLEMPKVPRLSRRTGLAAGALSGLSFGRRDEPYGP